MSEYFEKTAQAYRKLRIPEELTAPSAAVSSTVRGIEKLFATANPGLEPNQVVVICDRDKRTDVSEIRSGLHKDFNFRDCGSGNSDKCGNKAVLLPVR